MKILTIGAIPKDRIWRGTCYSCRSTAEAKEEELKNITFSNRGEDPFCWEICPVCNFGPQGGMLFYRQE